MKFYFSILAIFFFASSLSFFKLSAQELTADELKTAHGFITEITVKNKTEKPASHSAEVQKLIDQLGHNDFKIRNHATEELLTKKPKYLPLIETAVNSSDPEVNERAKRIRTAWEKKQKKLLETPLLPGNNRFAVLKYFRSEIYKGKFKEFEKVYKTLLKIDTKKQKEVKYLTKNLTDLLKDYINGQISRGPSIKHEELFKLAEMLLQNPKLPKSDKNHIMSAIILLHLSDNQIEKAQGLLRKHHKSIKNMVSFQEKLFGDLNRIKNKNPNIDYFTADVETIKALADLIPLTSQQPLSSGNSFMSNQIQFRGEKGWAEALAWAAKHNSKEFSIMENEYAFYIQIIYSEQHPEYINKAKQTAEIFFQRVFSDEKLKEKVKLTYFLNYWDPIADLFSTDPTISKAIAQFTPLAVEIYLKQGKDAYEIFDLARALNADSPKDEKWGQTGETLCLLWQKKKYQGSDARCLPPMLKLFLLLGKKNELKNILTKKKRLWRYPEYYAVLANNGAEDLAIDYLLKNWTKLYLVSSSSFAKYKISPSAWEAIESKLKKINNPDFSLFAKAFFAKFGIIQSDKNNLYRYKIIPAKRSDLIVQELSKHRFKKQDLAIKALTLMVDAPYYVTLHEQLKNIFTDDFIQKNKNTKYHEIKICWRFYLMGLLHNGEMEELKKTIKLLVNDKDNKIVNNNSRNYDSFFELSLRVVYEFMAGQGGSNVVFVPERATFSQENIPQLQELSEIMLEGMNDSPVNQESVWKFLAIYHGAHALSGKDAMLKTEGDLKRIFGEIKQTNHPYSFFSAIFADFKNEKEKRKIFRCLLDAFDSEEVREKFFYKRGNPIDGLKILPFYQKDPDFFDFEKAEFFYEKDKKSAEADRIVKAIVLFSDKPEYVEKAKNLFQQNHPQLNSAENHNPIWPMLPEKLRYMQVVPLSGINVLAMPGKGPFPDQNSFIMNWNLSQMFTTNYYACLKTPSIEDEADFNEWDGTEKRKSQNHIFNDREDQKQFGEIDLFDFFKPVHSWQGVYLSSYIFIPENADAQLLSASNSLFKIFLNGEEVTTTTKYPRSNIKLDAYKARIQLKKGLNHLIIKSIYSGRKQWWLRVRFTDEQGRPFQVKAIPANK